MTPREQNMLVGVAALLVALGLWSLVWQPASQSKTASLTRLSKIDAVQSALQDLPPSDEIRASVTMAPLQQRVTNSARDADVPVRRLDPQGAALSVSLDEVSFAALVRWMDTMTTTMGVRVLAAEIGRLAEPGVVSARLLLEDL